MPTAEYLRKAETIAQIRAAETAEIVRLFRTGMSRSKIAQQLDMPQSTVSDRLAAAGFAKGEPGRMWTDAENALVAELAIDLAATPKSIGHLFPGRNESVLTEKLRSARRALGLIPTSRFAAAAAPAAAIEPDDDGPNWPLPPNAMRGLHGITLPRVSILMEAR